ncbi:acyl-CoA thioesterase [Herbiconiux moechotypicola]|uniref:acyl-CoA thioesterase n=1 Tax=Herbiconiux moechotypicola TaxID=637393 RepID=UPI00217EE3BD|nr:acyl-CoA thioesterase [Herbiconiux moechotypicola]MCS5728833.1 acyl-CoA thioesterase [Herbiconiux moechotypicola]
MHFFFRTLWQGLLARFRSPLGLWDTASTPFRVLPTDLDVLRHMNNGVYLSILDIARLDLMLRSRTWPQLKERGWYPVVVSETISFRRSLQLWQRFTVETRTLGFDDRAVYMEQRFVVGGEVYARAYIKARFLKRSGGIVPMDELRALAGLAPGESAPGQLESSRMPAWLLEWGRDAQLPSTKTPAPSRWEGE